MLEREIESKRERELNVFRGVDYLGNIKCQCFGLGLRAGCHQGLIA